jgi:diguanylate cyclase (GGDEF)-like protein
MALFPSIPVTYPSWFADRETEGADLRAIKTSRFCKMKRFVSAVAVLLASLSTARAVEPAPLTTLNAIHALTNSQASHQLPVAFEATVTYDRAPERTLFVQDGRVGIYVRIDADARFVPGDRVLVRGRTRNSFNPYVLGESLTLLGHAALPKPAAANFDQMIRAETDCRLVTVHGVIRSANFMDPTPQLQFTTLQLLTEGGYFDATVDGADAGELEGLVDAEVELTGVASEKFDGKMQVTGILIHVQSASGVKILKRASTGPWSLPVTQMDRVLAVYHVKDTTTRVRVRGTITYYEPGSAVILQDGAKSIWIATETRTPLRVGDLADATGFPDAHNGFLNLVHGELRDSLDAAPITPLPVTWETLTPHGNTIPGHNYDLVSIEGRVVTQVQESSQDEYVIASGDKLFSAIFRHLDGPRPSTRRVPLGSKVRVTGICMLENANPFIAQMPFNILVRSDEDVAVIAGPSLLSVRNLTLALGLLFLIAFGAGTRSWALERKVRQKTAALAARIEAEAVLERRRSAILEDISGNRPLARILTQITQMLSETLDGVPCWCEIVDQTRLTDPRPALGSLRVVRTAVLAHTGEPLGFVFAGFRSGSLASTAETDALEVGARLATLAIESRRLYTDLLHRSEFDLLTDIHNRFSMEKHLDTQIGHALVSGTVFGLVYIDLDGFKQINDRFGHHAGDQYLQEAAIRMKNQLRPIDMLARLGGDEFAALIPEVNSRTDVEEIALRLEQCFDETFAVGGAHISGSTSVGVALYPMDGSSKDGLLQAADAAMYAAKHNKRKVREMLEATEDSGRN